MSSGSRRPPKSVRDPLGNESGLSLIEAITGTVIAIIAVLGLAYSFGVGRGLIDRYKIARVALALAEQRMETLTALPAGDDSLKINNNLPTTYGPIPFNVEGGEAGYQEWTVAWYDDPVDATDPGDLAPHDLKHLTVRLIWTHEGIQDTVSLSRMFEDQ